MIALLLLVACGDDGLEPATRPIDPPGAAPAGADAPSASSTPAAGTSPGAPAATPPDASPAPSQVRSSVTFFLSGHSLTDDPLASNIVAIAKSLGKQADYNEQIVIGSPIRVRTRGMDTGSSGWAGYSTGKNRSGSGLNVIDELRTGGTLGSGRRYDSLLITENHRMLEQAQWESTVKYLRHFHERLHEGDAQSSTYFYQSWLGVANKADPRSWISYERAAARVWQCIPTRINASLAHEGRTDRVVSVPVNWALASLVEQATQGNVAGVTRGSVTETMNGLFSDDVHLTAVGAYYAALVSYAALYGSSPVGAAAPQGVSPAQAASLQAAAWQALAGFAALGPPMDLGQCRATLRESFCATYFTYVGSPGNAASCASFWGATSDANPLYFAAATNASYWYPAPP